MFDAIIDEVIKLLGAAIAAGVLGIVAMLLRKLGVSLSADKQAQLELYVRQGINRAEEYAANYAKDRVTKLAPEAKLRIAVSHVLKHAPGLSEDDAKSAVEAALPAMGVGATVPKAQ